MRSLTPLFSILLLALGLSMFCHSVVLAEKPCTSPKAKCGLTVSQIKEHQRIVGKIPIRDYKNIVPPGTGKGLGGVIAPVQKDWDQVCFPSGFCVNVINTNKAVDTVGGAGCHKVKRMGYTLRELAAQLNQTSQPHKDLKPLVTLMRKLVNTTDDLGLAMVSLETCAINHTCDLSEEFRRFSESPHNLLSQFDQQKDQLIKVLESRPELLAAYPEMPGVIHYQLAEISRIAHGVSVIYNPSSQKIELANPVQYSAQDGDELCKAAGDDFQCQMTHGN
ncbi:MAG: hypothetical protein K2X01_03570 [Cyanobacteria bacterium]|nr:hypothetical protein [Cyanobacteriota bacterium]